MSFDENHTGDMVSQVRESTDHAFGLEELQQTTADTQDMFSRNIVSHDNLSNDVATVFSFEPDQGQQRDGTALQSKLRTIIIMSSICLGGAMVSMDSVIVSVALPTIANELAMTSAQYSWVGSSYLLAGASSMPLWEPLSSSVGRKPVLSVGLVLFLLGSALAAVAHSPPMLIAGRTVQGIGEGAFTIMANICMADLFPLRVRSLYIAMYAGASCIGAGLAPLIGGALTQYVSWRWVFWVNLPITAVVLVLALVFLPFPLITISTWRNLSHVDLRGVLLITSGTTILLLGLQFNSIFFPWNSPTVLGLLVAGGMTVVLFILQQTWLASGQPLVPFRMFRDRTAFACLSVSFLHGSAYITALFYMPVYFEVVLNIAIFETGLWLLLTAVPTTIFTIAAALMIQKTGRYALVTQLAAGCLALGLGLAITFPSYRSLARIIIFQLILAGGIGPLFQTPLVGLQAAVRKDDVSNAYATAIFLRTISSAMGLVVVQVVLSNALRANSDTLLNAGIPGTFVDALQRDISELARSSGIGSQQQEAVKVVVAFSLTRVWLACTVVAGLCFVASCFINDLPLDKEVEGNGRNEN